MKKYRVRENSIAYYTILVGQGALFLTLFGGIIFIMNMI